MGASLALGPAGSDRRAVWHEQRFPGRRKCAHCIKGQGRLHDRERQGSLRASEGRNQPLYESAMHWLRVLYALPWRGGYPRMLFRL